MKRGAYLCFALALAVLVVWLAQGGQLVTLTSQVVKETVVDEFGDKVEKPKMVPTFRIGLLEIAGPAMGLTVSTGVLLLWLARRRVRRGSAEAKNPT